MGCETPVATTHKLSSFLSKVVQTSIRCTQISAVRRYSIARPDSVLSLIYVMHSGGIFEHFDCHSCALHMNRLQRATAENILTRVCRLGYNGSVEALAA